MNFLKQKLIVATCLITGPFGVLADTITLTSPDGKISIVGDLVSFDDETLILSTNVGELSILRALVSCEGEDCPEPVNEFDLFISTNGSASADLAQTLAVGFASTQSFVSSPSAGGNGSGTIIELRDTTEAQNEGSVNITTQPASAGFEQLGSGQADVYLSKAAVPAGIADQVIAAGQVDPRDESRERVVALDALVPLVHPNNPVQSVSLEELSQIAAGRISNWSEIGGNDAPIHMLLPAAGSPLEAAFVELVLDPNRVRLRRSAERAESESQAAATVAADVNAITITSLSGSEGGEALPIRQSCGPLAYADDFSIKAEEYPLSQRVYAYTPSEITAPFKADFLEYMSSPDGQSLIKGAGYVDQSIQTQPISVQGTRMTSAILAGGANATLELIKNFAQDLAAADRLSTTFRFSSASSDLDTKSQSDVERMALFLAAAEVRNRDILVIGFSDDVGRFDLNERLALLRAETVRDALVNATGGAALAERIEISAYGPLAPVGCNDTANGRKNNRRVEIWLR